jgi:DNA primase
VSRVFNTISDQRCQPAIDEIVQAYGIELRRAGRELVGLCPFHADKYPSFAVNPDKNLWYCFACAEGGDAIRFVQKIHSISFKEALHVIGIDGDRAPEPRPLGRARREAKKIAAWARDKSRQVCDALCEIGQEIYVCSLARKSPDADLELIAEHEASLLREWEILCDLDDDLSEPQSAIELWNDRFVIDALIERL